MTLQGEVPAISGLARTKEPWSSYTEGWNDALDLAEQAAVREMSRLEDEYRRILWIIAKQNGGRIVIPDSELVAVPRLPGIVVTKNEGARVTTIDAQGVEPVESVEHEHAWVTDGVQPEKDLCLTCRERRHRTYGKREKW